MIYIRYEIHELTHLLLLESTFVQLDARPILLYLGDLRLKQQHDRHGGRGCGHARHRADARLRRSSTASHPENILLQLSTEWGLLGATLAIGFGVFGWWHAFKGIGRRTNPVHWALIAGLAAVGVQQLADFGLESISLSLPVAVAFGLALGGCSRQGPLGRPRTSIAGVLLTFALMLGAVIAWKGPAALAGHPDHALASIQDSSDDEVFEVAKAQALQHPADYMVPLNTTLRLARLPDASLPEMLRWANRALHLYPEGGRMHLLVARLLMRSGLRDQALVEYRLAIKAQPWQERVLMTEVGRRFKQPERLARSVVSSKGAWWLGNTLLQERRPALARDTMRQVLELRPRDVEAHGILTRACVELKQFECAARSASWLTENGRVSAGHAFLALVAVHRRDHEAAHGALRMGAEEGKNDPDFQRTAVDVYARLGNLEAARAAAGRLWRLVGADPRTGAKALALRARLEARLGDVDLAARAYNRAYKLDGRPKYGALAARYTAEAGRHEEAARILRDARQRWPDDPTLRATTIDKEAPANSSSKDPGRSSKGPVD